MALLPILLTATASILCAMSFAAVAAALRRRRYSLDLREAGQAYVVWWVMFSVQAGTDAFRVLLGLNEPVDVNLYLVLAALKIVAAGIGLWALGRYVIFLWNGKRWVSFPMMVFAGLHTALFLWLLYRGLPADVTVGVWSPRLVLSGTSLPEGVGTLARLSFFLPTVLLAGAYLALRSRMESPAQKVRVTSIAIAILVFQAVAAVQFNPATSADTPIFALLALVNAAVGLFIYATYDPPPWMAKRLRMESGAVQSEQPSGGQR